MVAQFTVKPCELLHDKPGRAEYVVDPQRGRYLAEGTPDSGPFFGKAVQQPFSDGLIWVGIRHIVEVTAYNYGIGTVFNFLPYPVGLFFSFPDRQFEFSQDAPCFTGHTR